MWHWILSLNWSKILEIGLPIVGYIAADTTVKLSPLTTHNGLPQMAIGIAKGIGRGIVSAAPQIAQEAAQIDPKHAQILNDLATVLQGQQDAIKAAPIPSAVLPVIPPTTLSGAVAP
jgi:hypothetical protein